MYSDSYLRLTTLVQGALARLGYLTDEYRHCIEPYATPGGCLGLVNYALGVAVETSLRLPADLVEDGAQRAVETALVSPLQGRAPAGWVRLEAPTCTVSPPHVAPAPMPEDFSAAVVTWGLRTQYGFPGLPGLTELDPELEAPRMPIEAWPASEAQTAAMRRIAFEGLRQAALVLARGVADRPDVADLIFVLAPNNPAGWGAVSEVLSGAVHRFGAEDDSRASWAARETAPWAVNRVLEGSALELLSRFAERGQSTTLLGFARNLLELALLQRLQPALATLLPLVEPLIGEHELPHMAQRPVAQAITDQLLPRLLRDARQVADDARRAVVAAYYADGPVQVHIPLVLPAEAAA